jgi:hypothetical protein
MSKPKGGYSQMNQMSNTNINASEIDDQLPNANFNALGSQSFVSHQTHVPMTPGLK